MSTESTIRTAIAAYPTDLQDAVVEVLNRADAIEKGRLLRIDTALLATKAIKLNMTGSLEVHPSLQDYVSTMPAFLMPDSLEPLMEFFTLYNEYKRGCSPNKRRWVCELYNYLKSVFDGSEDTDPQFESDPVSNMCALWMTVPLDVHAEWQLDTALEGPGVPGFYQVETEDNTDVSELTR